MNALSNRLHGSIIFLAFVAVACSPESLVESTQDAVAMDEMITESDAFPSVDSETSFEISDTGSSPGEFGYPCVSNADCNVGYCTETSKGNICSKACVTECPEDFVCTGVSAGGSDIMFVCLSKFVRICDPCHEHKDCNTNDKIGNLCLGVGGGGRFCGVQCNPANDDKDCPTSFTCKFVTDGKTGLSGNQCVPSKNATCSCSTRAIQLALSTDCENKNVFGACYGQRVCKPEGLTNCIGQIPESESCNKLDDNCDGEIDNIDPKSVGGTCQQSNEFGTCFGVISGCDKGNPICNASVPQPEACNGKDDDCDGKTDEGLCDDGNVCTTDLCNTDGSCKHIKISGTACDDGNVCTTFEQCSSGVCMGGTVLNCDDADSCSVDWCDPFTGCNHKPASDVGCLDDGNVCTQDVCLNGKCTHPKAKDGGSCLDEGNVCTTDVCDNGECSHISNSKPCDDGNQCTLNDSCKDKACIISLPKVCNDGNACTVDSCESAKGCLFKPNPFSSDGTGVPCPDDGNACTEDLCKGSICAHLPIPGCN